MSESKWQQTLDSFGQEVAAIAEKADVLSEVFAVGRRQAELLKLEYLTCCLEHQRRHLARARGFVAICRDGRGLRQSLVAGALGVIAGGIVGRDKLFAVEWGLSSLDAALQANGQTTWAVVLSKDLIVLPEDDLATAQGRTLVTWQSFMDALKGLAMEALQGADLGDLDTVLIGVQRRKELVHTGIVAKTIG